MGFDVRHRGQPDGQQQILEPARGEALEPVPHARRVAALRDAAAGLECPGDVVEHADERGQLLKHAADEHGSPFLRERRCMLGRQREAPARCVESEIAGRGEPAEPLSQVTFVETRALRELRRCCGPVSREILEETQAVAEGGEQHGHRAAELSEQFAGERFLE